MDLKYQTEVLAVFDRLQSTAPTSKDDVRRIMAGRRLEELRAHRRDLVAVEARGLALIRRVDYTKPIRPTLVFCAPDDRPVWMFLRHVLSSAPFTHRPFRALFLFCVDANSGGVLGIVDIGADVSGLAPRDRFVGWNTNAKKFARLSTSINAGTIIGVPPFGWLTGCKFMVEALASRLIADTWRYRYGDPAAMVVTTSLFGRSSVYNRLPSFRYVGDTSGVGTFHMSAVDWRMIQRFLSANSLAARTQGIGPGRANGIWAATKALGVDLSTLSSHQPRGVYVSIPNDDARAFLRGDRADLPVSYTRTVDDVATWWHDRWYTMRFPKVIDQIRTWDVTSLRVDRQIALCGRSAESGTAIPVAGV